MDSSNIICKNCGNVFRLNYCNQCGQPAYTPRIGWKEIAHYLPHAMLHLDKGFFYTIKELATRPGYVLRGYLEGKRKPYYNPFLLLILASAFCTFLFIIFHLDTILAVVKVEKLEKENTFVAHKFMVIRAIYFGLVCSVGDYLLFYRRGYNLPEMILVNTFAFAEISIFQILLIPLLLLGRHFNFSRYIAAAFLIIALGYMFLVRYQFYKTAGNNKLVLKIALALLCYIIFILISAQTIVKPFFGN